MPEQFKHLLRKSPFILGAVILSFCYTQHLNAQKLTFGKRIIVGTSLTHISNSSTMDAKYRELSWTKNVSTNINHYLYFGLEHISIYGSGSEFLPESNTKLRANLLGTFIKLDLFEILAETIKLGEKSRLLLEMSAHIGDYCTCGDNIDPYVLDGLKYLGLGLGYEYRINHFLSLDLAFTNKNILNDIDSKYNFTQYIVGLNLDFDATRTEQTRAKKSS